MLSSIAFLRAARATVGPFFMLRKFYAMALRCNSLEKKYIKDYGCLPNIDSEIEWVDELRRYEVRNEVVANRIKLEHWALNLDDFELVD